MTTFTPARASQPKRQQKNMRMAPEAAQMLKRMAEHFKTSESDVVETLLMTYGPKILISNPGNDKRRKA